MKTPPNDPAATSTRAMLRWHEAIPGDRLAHLVRDTRRGLVRALRQRLSEHSIASGHWTFLRILWLKDGQTQRELSDLAGVMEPTTFAALRDMERLGYIARQRRPENKKNIYVFLTPEGRALESKLVPIAEAINDRALRGVSAEDIATTRRTMLAMIQNLADGEAEAADATRRAPSPRVVVSSLAPSANVRGAAILKAIRK